MDRESNVVFLPCGHGGICDFCTKDLLNSNSKDRRCCHICRIPIGLIARIKKVKNEGKSSPSFVGTAVSPADLGLGNRDI